MSDTHRRELHQLNTAIQAAQKGLFSSSNSASKAQLTTTSSKIEDYREAFSNLSWVARDVAGDIRTAAVDFRHVIMGTLEDTQTKNDAKVTLLDNWCKSMESKRKAAQELHQQFERFSRDLSDLARDIRTSRLSETAAGQSIAKAKALPKLPFWKRILLALFGKHQPTGSSTAKSPRPSPHAKTSAQQQHQAIKSVMQQPQEFQASKKALEAEIESTRKKVTIIITKSQTFAKIYNEIDQNIQTLRRLLSNKNFNTKKESEYNASLASFKPKLEQYAKILEEYQKAVP